MTPAYAVRLAQTGANGIGVAEEVAHTLDGASPQAICTTTPAARAQMSEPKLAARPGNGLRYLSVCSGIEAATVAWHPLGWTPAAFSEIEAFPRAVLSHHYPSVPLHGDFTTIQGTEYGPVDLLVGGTPCQSFSVAGLRKGMADPRGNLALGYLGLADRLRARWLVWENVPGVLSSNGGRDFGAFLGGLAELGYGFAYRVLDAQYFGVPQRRRRVFVVGYLGDWRRAAAVLFERHSLSGYPAPSREAGSRVAALTAGGVGTCGADDNQAQAGHLIAFQATGNGLWREGLGPLASSDDNGTNQCVAHTLRADGFDASEDGTGRGTPLVAVAFNWQSGGDVRHNVSASGTDALTRGQTPAIAFDTTQITSPVYRTSLPPEICHTLASGAHPPAIIGPAVRRITPREAERLQGFPDDYTLVPVRGKPAADSPRYKALGNSMAVPCMEWIGRRIAEVEALDLPAAEAA